MDAVEGKRIWVTAERRSGAQRRFFESRGAHVVAVPLMKTIDSSSVNDVEAIADALIADPPEVFITQTGQGLQWWTDRLHEAVRGPFLKALGEAQVWSRGAKSTSRCRSLGLEVAWQSPHETASEIASRCRELPSGTRVALQLAGTVDDIVLDALHGIDADVIVLRVYRYQLPQDLGPCLEVIDSVIDGDVDAITFTSSPAILHLRAIARATDTIDRLDASIGADCLPVVVGPVCAATARDAGWDNIVEPDTARLLPMLNALATTLTPPSGQRLE